METIKALGKAGFLQIGQRGSHVKLRSAEGLFVSPSPVPRHQEVAGNINDRLRSYARITGGKAFFGPLDVYFAVDKVVEPDLVFIRADHLGQIGAKRLEGPPDLVVEISSPSTRHMDQGRKRELYGRFGVPEYWLVDLKADQVEVYVLSDGSYGPQRSRLPARFLSPPGCRAYQFWCRRG